MEYVYKDKIEIYLSDVVNVEEIEDIAEEVFEDKDLIINVVEVYEDTISISTTEITLEEKESLIEKINEKYGKELISDDYEIVTVPNTELKSVISPYIIPVISSLIIICGYYAIVYRKQGAFTVILKTIFFVILIEAILFSIYAITRLPINYSTTSIGLSVYLLAIVVIGKYFEKTDIKFKKELNTKRKK